MFGYRDVGNLDTSILEDPDIKKINDIIYFNMEHEMTPRMIELLSSKSAIWAFSDIHPKLNEFISNIGYH
jgi:hypothetical protein